MADSIPKSWRDEVVAILKTQDRKLIEWTFRAKQEWVIFGFEYEAYDAMIVALTNPDAAGNQVTPLNDIVESYEFLFQFNGIPMYGKIGLKKSRLSILIISAHRAKRTSL